MMNFMFTFKGLESSEAIKNYAQKKFLKLEKYFEGPVEVQVLFKREKFREIVEVIMGGDGEHLVVKEETEDIYSSIDFAYESLEKQIKKLKEKRREFRGEKVSEEISEEPEEGYLIKQVDLVPMSTEEAYLWFKKSKDNFFVFYNTDYQKVCIFCTEKNRPLLIVPEFK